MVCRVIKKSGKLFQTCRFCDLALFLHPPASPTCGHSVQHRNAPHLPSLKENREKGCSSRERTKRILKTATSSAYLVSRHSQTLSRAREKAGFGIVIPHAVDMQPHTGARSPFHLWPEIGKRGFKPKTVKSAVLLQNAILHLGVTVCYRGMTPHLGASLKAHR